LSTAQAQSATSPPATSPPVPPSVNRSGAAGNYLAARAANLQRDAAAASAYYRAALRTDPRNPELSELAF
jgi:hypothetical protein